MSFEELAKRIASVSTRQCGCGASREQISNVMNGMGVVFPESYIWFLKEYGWVRLGGDELYGLGPDIPAYLELGRITESERKDARPHLKHYLVPIMNDGAGNHYCLDTLKMNEGECPVVFWDHELGEEQEPQCVSGSFSEWLNTRLEELS